MNDYVQPDFYRFNEDSLALIKYIISKLNKASSILDLGTGSGVLGIELANNFKSNEVVLLEIQTAFIPYLEENIRDQLNSNTKAEVILSSFSEWVPHKKFDLIVCNPPYYLPGHGQVSIDEKRHICRTFVKDNWDILMQKISLSLSREGRAFLVVKKDQRILTKIIEFGHTFNMTQVELNDLIIFELAGLDIN
jgi:tRNA1Val (adenine37-N6)-methyltransferase